MSATAAPLSSPPIATDAATGGAKALAPLIAAWLMALAVIAATFLPMGIAAVDEGFLFDNDDAMRLVQIREWMDGKSWFDLTERRVDPPEGMLSHWPRLIELPIAGGIAILSLALDRDLSERLVIALWPCALLAALVLGMLILARRLFAPPILFAGAIIVALNPLLQFQLAPGRIDHHGVQMLLSLVLAFATIRALVDNSAHAAVTAGAVAALMQAIGLETLPLVAVATALFGLAWIIRGDACRRVLAHFGLTLAFATPALFAATIAPSRWSMTACDALSPPWLWLAFGGGLALSGLAFIDAPAKITHRAAWALAASITVVVFFVAFWPHCLKGPLADIDPLVGQLWLQDVGEAEALLSLVSRDPEGFLFFLAFPLLGWLALGVASYREGRARPDLAVLLVFATVGMGMAFIAMRGVPFASIFALFGWLYLLDRALAPVLQRTAKSGSASLFAGSAIVVLVAALPFLWTALGAAAKPSLANEAPRASCGAQADMAVLAAQPKGLMLAPLRLGPRILVATDHDVLGVPYHRNNRGNRATFETLLASESDAERMIRQRGVRYVALCLGDTDLPNLEAYRPDSLLNRLVEGKPPSWLTPLATRGPIEAWRIAN